MAYKFIESAQTRWRSVNATPSGATGASRSHVQQGGNSSNDPMTKQVKRKSPEESHPQVLTIPRCGASALCLRTNSTRARSLRLSAGSGGLTGV